MIYIGTPNFVTRAAAISYYHDYHPGASFSDVAKIVDRKVADGDIYIGKPATKPGQTLGFTDNMRRYLLIEEERS